jgi:hypothetical protein
MPYPVPDTRNVTKPGGISVHADFGSGYAHLGNIDITKLSVDPKNEDFEFESQLSGEMRLADSFISKRRESYKLALQEVTPEHLQHFYLGGDLETVGEGSAAAVDQKLILAGELPASLGKYGISAVTVRQFLDWCFLKDHSAADAFVDNSVEADTAAGTPFSTLEEALDELYLGKITPFTEVYFDFAVPGVYGAVVVKYWNGAAWAAVSNLGGAADVLDADGKMNWDLPADWAQTQVNGQTGYWLQITATTPWTTPATVNCIRQNAVRNTDYIQDPGQVAGGLQAGRIGRLAAGFLADGEEVMVSYTYSTWTSLTFPVATAQYPVVAVRIDYLTLKGTQMRRHIPRAQLKPDGAITFDPKKELQIPLLLEVLDDYANNPTRPYGWKEIIYS